MERGPELASRNFIMTLTYRGQKYVQNSAAATSTQRPVLVYRGTVVQR